METKDGREPAPPIRGVLRAELIRDRALGELTIEQLAEKYGRSIDAIKQFSSYNKDEIRRAKQAQSDEYQSLGYAFKSERIALRDRLIAGIVDRMESGDLTDSQWKGYGNLVDKLARSIAEERGELYQRSQVEVRVIRLPVSMRSILVMTGSFVASSETGVKPGALARGYAASI